uniref:NADH:ubiquinone reductase (H(+)-translocating) n=1 Tax=Paragonimus ohirai TaxID=59629 RepID=A0A1J0MNS8_9TREM|nr:NADH dehydrogenase subunit 5 [Paragonimus ohirai]APD26978.1 NADH dehydrogenase subunit 5 [Paragonimus ohirai]
MLALSVVLVLGSLVFWSIGLVGLGASLNVWNYAWKDGVELLMLDEVSLICSFMLFCCGSLALLYCYHYFADSGEGVLLFPLIVWFLGVMGILIFSSSLIFSLVLWEYLGLVSFLLILFYSNSSSVRASLITLFASRFGDVSLFMLILWCGVWWGIVLASFFSFFFLLVVLSKSAGYPFISWLLEAMRAPTPVSSLVHSSTLVAAGVWFLLRYQSLLVSFLSGWLCLFCVLTIILSGMCASFFNDLKKVVALSTCNNISWCVVFFVCGDLFLCLLQLLTHGVCKCYLFMSVGDLMSQSGGSQSSVGVYGSRYVGVLGPILQSVLVFSLSGLPFMGVFFSKHGLFSAVSYCYGLGFLLVFWFAFFLTYVYSVRLSLLLLKVSSGLSSGYFSAFLPIAGLCLLGTFLNWFGLILFDESFSLGIWWGSMMLLVQALGCLMGWFLFLGVFSSGVWVVWNSLLWGSDCLVGFIYDGFLKLTEVAVLSFYRWELYSLALFKAGGDNSFIGVFTSLNLLVLGSVFVIFLFSLFFC